MRLQPIEAVERRAADLSRRLALGTLGAVAMGAGFGFLTVAAWLVLDAWKGALFAAGTIGSAYLGLGLVLLALACKGKSRRPARVPEESVDPFVRMATGFAAGLEAGRAAREGRMDRR
ncbi:phage holin family protein [Rhodovulum euryhalinum]|uniref:Putative superfamily III holin-X n=1 Tax=Rhodovulum euryhalinum TaxID=35805 RepID=A0A4R2KBW6_9RHOB|nr:phage holin family protein [Rhodovulum euryhalinum]TCO69557.1 putative superfamily III holin-X [Rhodovulum euryhalinum]